jgi:hypothetical protein
MKAIFSHTKKFKSSKPSPNRYSVIKNLPWNVPILSIQKHPPCLMWWKIELPITFCLSKTCMKNSKTGMNKKSFFKSSRLISTIKNFSKKSSLISCIILIILTTQPFSLYWSKFSSLIRQTSSCTRPQVKATAVHSEITEISVSTQKIKKVPLHYTI